jgi:hypothetical protein
MPLPGQAEGLAATKTEINFWDFYMRIYFPEIKQNQTFFIFGHAQEYSLAANLLSH